jgi:antitoxin component of MazEF toxin-antitoxin module
MKKLILKLIQIGNSKGIVIPAYVLDELQADTGDLLEIEIKGIQKTRQKGKEK